MQNSALGAGDELLFAQAKTDPVFSVARPSPNARRVTTTGNDHTRFSAVKLQEDLHGGVLLYLGLTNFKNPEKVLHPKTNIDYVTEPRLSYLIRGFKK